MYNISIHFKNNYTFNIKPIKQCRKTDSTESWLVNDDDNVYAYSIKVNWKLKI